MIEERKIARRGYLYGRTITICISVYTLEIYLICIILFAVHNNSVLAQPVFMQT